MFIIINLELRGKLSDPSPLIKLSEWSEKYGPIYTIWAGHTPLIMVNSFEANTEAAITRKNDFINRPDNIMCTPFEFIMIGKFLNPFVLDAILRNGRQNVTASNGPYWEALRKVAFFAIR